MAARSFGIPIALNPYQVQEAPNNHMFCAIIASCYEMDVYP